MGEAKRRRDRGELTPNFDPSGVIADAKGVLHFEFWKVEELPNAPDYVIEAFVYLVEMLSKSPCPLCVFCERVAPRKPSAGAFISGYCDKPNQVLPLPVCDACAAKPRDVIHTEMTQVFSGMRAFSIHPSSGTA